MFDMTCCFLARKVKLERYKQRMSSKFWHARSGTLTCDWCGWLVTILWARSHPIIDLCGNKKNVFHEDRLNPNSILMSHANFEELQIYWMCQKLGLLNKSLIKLCFCKLCLYPTKEFINFAFLIFHFYWQLGQS